MKKASMKFLLSLDYELFFGNKTGSVQNCLIKPIDKLLQIVEPHGMKLSLFVDSSFLLRLKKESVRHSSLVSEYEGICTQLANLVRRGHDVQLHVHSHWEDCRFNGTDWDIDVSRYRLHDFSDNDINNIIKSNKELLEEVSNNEVFAFRAGGWCLQPFDKLKNPLIQNGIWLDSTVYDGGLSEDADRFYDFRHAPKMANWRFNDDPMSVNTQGEFLEIPISSMKMNPLFYWKLIATKKILKGQFRSFGDGEVITASKSYYLDRLLKSSISPVTLDGAKAGLLSKAYKQSGKDAIFNVMGHPKTLSEYSLKALKRFLEMTPELESVTYQDYKHLREAGTN